MTSRKKTPTLTVPPHENRTVTWQQSQRAGTKEDRMTREVTVSLPPLLAQITLTVPDGMTEELRQAHNAVVETDARYGHALTALNTFLIRTEGVASSKIEHVEASAMDYALALAGNHGNASAIAMVDAGSAINQLVSGSSGGTGITAQAILAAHQTLMKSDPTEIHFAGSWRTMQNWIGGSNYAPRNALYVPPPAETVEMYMADLVAFAQRQDMDPLLQATLVHAQFESIHPFTDGNGRIGRALINAVLRYRGVTSRTIVPLASALVANTERYFAALGAYRVGDLAPLLRDFVSGTRIAAEETQVAARTLVSLKEMWHDRLETREGSASRRLIDVLLDVQTVTSQWVEKELELTPRSALGGIDELEEAGIVTEITGRKRNRVWVVTEVMAELEELNRRIGARVNG
jgi:Fic family protein